MKAALCFATALATAALCGCSMSSRGGGFSHDDSFRIVGPADTTIKQGEVQVVTLNLERGDQFKRDVKLDIRAPKGVRIDPDEVTVAASEKPEVEVRIAADRDAALGEYDVYVKGTPESGHATSMDFSVHVVSAQ